MSYLGTNLNVVGSSTLTSLNITNTTVSTSKTTGSLISSSTLTASGNITANSFKSLTGSIAGTNTAQTVYTINSGTRGYITVTSATGNLMTMGFFEWTSGLTNTSITSLTPVNNLQLSVTTNNIQVANQSGNGTIFYYITLL